MRSVPAPSFCRFLQPSVRLLPHLVASSERACCDVAVRCSQQLLSSKYPCSLFLLPQTSAQLLTHPPHLSPFQLFTVLSCHDDLHMAFFPSQLPNSAANFPTLLTWLCAFFYSEQSYTLNNLHNSRYFIFLCQNVLTNRINSSDKYTVFIFSSSLWLW